MRVNEGTPPDNPTTPGKTATATETSIALVTHFQSFQNSVNNIFGTGMDFFSNMGYDWVKRELEHKRASEYKTWQELGPRVWSPITLQEKLEYDKMPGVEGIQLDVYSPTSGIHLSGPARTEHSEFNNFFLMLAMNAAMGAPNWNNAKKPGELDFESENEEERLKRLRTLGLLGVMQE